MPVTVVTTNCTFTPTGESAVTFRMRGSGFRDTRSAVTSNEHVPWGDYNIEQMGGRGPRSIAMTAFFESHAAFVTMQGHLGDGGVLLWPFNGIGGDTVLLETCDMLDLLLAGGAVAASLAFTVEAS